MSEVNETELPGVGIRYDFDTRGGPRLGVLVHRTGRRELLVYDEADPDACVTSIGLDEGEARTLAEVMGASRIAEHVTELHQEVEGLAMDWIKVHDGAEWAGQTLLDAEIHTRTGVSIVAILRDGTTIPAPHSSEQLRAGDVAVAVGTAEGVAAATQALQAPPT